MKNPPLMFIDIETLGLDKAAPIWEIAVIKIWPSGAKRYLEMAR